MKKLFLLLLLSISCALSYIDASQQSLTAFIPSEDLINNSTIIGTGTVSIQSKQKDASSAGIYLHGKIIVSSAVVSNVSLPLEIPFIRKVYNQGVASDRIWGIIQGFQMNGLKVLVFASASSGTTTLLSAQRADLWSKEQIDELKAIWDNRNQTPENFDNLIHCDQPIVAKYFIFKTIESNLLPHRKVALVAKALNCHDDRLRSFGFENSLVLAQLLKDDQSRHEALTAVLSDLMKDGDELENRLSTFKRLGVEVVKKNPAWRQETESALSAIRNQQGSVATKQKINEIMQALQ